MFCLVEKKKNLSVFLRSKSRDFDRWMLWLTQASVWSRPPSLCSWWWLRSERWRLLGRSNLVWIVDSSKSLVGIEAVRYSEICFSYDEVSDLFTTIKVLFEGRGERRARKRNTQQHDADADELTSRFDPGHGFLLVSLKCLVCCHPSRPQSIPVLGQVFWPPRR